jgi:hypothetical protein
MKRILVLVAAMMMVMVPVFAQDQQVTVGGEAEYNVEYSSVEVGDADAVNKLMLGDAGRISLYGSASKDLANGAKASVETRFDIKYDEFGKDYIRLKYMNGPLTVQMLKADRPGIINKGLDKYVPEGAWYGVEATSERDVSFKYAPEGGMAFTTTINFKGSNFFAIRPHVAIPVGGLTAEAAVEYARDFAQDMDADGPTTSTYGGGAALEGAFGAIWFSVSGAYGITAATDVAGVDADDVNTLSAYASSKITVGTGTIGVAGGYNKQTSDSYANDKSSVQGNVTFEFPVMVPGLKVQGGAGYVTITDQNDVDTKKTGGKFAVVYGF